MKCSRCHEPKPVTAFRFRERSHDGQKRRRNYCVACERPSDRDLPVWGKDEVNLQRSYDMLARVDGKGCLWHCGCDDYCSATATWRNGAWRACDEHRLSGDKPITSAETARTSGS